MTLDDLKQEIATQQGERMEEVFKFIKEQALSGEFEVRLFGDRVNRWQIEQLKLIGYTVKDYGSWYIVSGW